MIFTNDGLLLMLLAVVLGLGTQGYVNSTYRRFSREPSASGMTGAQAARRILDSNGLMDVTIQRVGGNLTDHYDPRSRVLSLSASVYDGASVAAAGVAAHEVGHAVQHARGYFPATVRASLVPAANIGSRVAPLLILAGFLVNLSGLVWLGIVLFSCAVAFQVVTLPVELDASSRATSSLAPAGILSEEQLPGARSVLRAAALTYVAGTLISVLYLLYYTGLARRD
jgi:Zn-dependent membrane protease YugP